MFGDWKYKKYAYGALGVFALIAGYFAVDAGAIDLVKSVFGVFFNGTAPVGP